MSVSRGRYKMLLQPVPVAAGLPGSRSTLPLTVRTPVQGCVPPGVRSGQPAGAVHTSSFMIDDILGRSVAHVDKSKCTSPRGAPDGQGNRQHPRVASDVTHRLHGDTYNEDIRVPVQGSRTTDHSVRRTDSHHGNKLLLRTGDQTSPSPPDHKPWTSLAPLAHTPCSPGVTSRTPVSGSRGVDSIKPPPADTTPLLTTSTGPPFVPGGMVFTPGSAAPARPSPVHPGLLQTVRPLGSPPHPHHPLQRPHPSLDQAAERLGLYTSPGAFLGVQGQMAYPPGLVQPGGLMYDPYGRQDYSLLDHRHHPYFKRKYIII